MSLTQERKDQLESAYQANIAAGRAPYIGVLIRDTDELTWIYDQRNWSGRFWLEDGKSRPNLYRANLYRANLYRANLSEANLSEADLSRANLSSANLSEANLSEADLSSANLYRANLSEANLYRADLSSANLSEANLYRANLSSANLSEANLSAIKNDIYAIVDLVPMDLPFLISALERGEVDGSVYHNNCGQGCLVGTLQNAEIQRIKTNPELTKIDIPENSYRPAERWFLSIRPGHTPENSQIVAWTVGILKERVAMYDHIARVWTPTPIATVTTTQSEEFPF